MSSPTMRNKARFQAVVVFLFLLQLCTFRKARSLRLNDNKKRDLLQLKVIGGVDSSLEGGVLLTKCQGDCDGDYDCAPGLKCMARYGDEPVPGCDGVATCVDFCYDPNEVQSPVASPTTSSPSLHPTEPIPTSMPTNKKVPLKTSSNFPLEKCAGSCRDDSQCRDGYVCFRRNFDGYVPGCTGDGFNGVDFCIDPKDNPSNYNSDDRFNIKMYWEPGYTWQGETFERQWCLKCTDGRCNKDDMIVVTKCGRSDARFRYLNEKGKDTQIQISNTNLCLEMREGKDLLFVGNCNKDNPLQFFNSGNGDFLGLRFELLTPGEPGCLTTHHHPKGQEAVRRADCADSRFENTSFWMKYD